MADSALAESLPRTVEAFDAWHARRPERWEFVGGRPRMMAPASRRHTIIKGNVYRAIESGLGDRGCRAYVDGLQVRTDAISAIPDVVVECGPADLDSPVADRPVVIVVILSPSSEEDDTGRKWRAYRQIAGLQHYLVVSQTARLVEIHSRTGPFSWDERFPTEGAIDLPAIGVTLSFDELYRDTGIG